MITRRTLLAQLVTGTGLTALAGIGCRGAGAPGACRALTGRRLRWIVPNAPGGGYDTEARLLQPFLERRMAVEIVIENKEGAGGLIGARAIADARPDGLTLGSAGMPGLLIAALLHQPQAVDPLRAFTILCRISRSAHVWALGAQSALKTIDDVIAAGRERPLVFAINEVASASFVSITVSAALLGVRIELVPGFTGTRASSLAAARGDVDLVCFDFDTIRPLIIAGELRPILQLDTMPLSDVNLEGVALLGGPAGVVSRLTHSTGEGLLDEVQIASALARVIGSGRVVIAPRGLDPTLAACVGNAIQEVLVSGELTGLTRSLDVATGAAARLDVERAIDEAARLIPIVAPALARLRG